MGNSRFFYFSFRIEVFLSKILSNCLARHQDILIIRTVKLAQPQMSVPTIPLETIPEGWAEVGMHDAFKQRRSRFDVVEDKNRGKLLKLRSLYYKIIKTHST